MTHIRLAALAALCMICASPITACSPKPTPISPSQPTPTTGEPDKTAIPLTAELVRAKLERDTAPQVLDENLASIAQGNTQFAFDLYHQTASQDSGNLIFSPYSISLAFAMVSAGAVGDTQTQIANTLHFTLPQDQLHPAFNALDLSLEGPQEEQVTQAPTNEGETGNLTLRIANALWGQSGFEFNQMFLDTLAQNYGAGMRVVDYENAPEESRQQINQWVSDETEERIQNLIPQDAITPDTRLVLTNAIYFYGGWSTQFDKEATQDALFTGFAGSESTVPMMHLQGFQTAYASGDGWQAATLPYGQDHSAEMIVILPKASRFAEIEAAMDAAKFEEIRSALQTNHAMLNLSMPRWDFEGTFSLNETLKAMGMTTPFEEDADFSGITTEKKLAITDVIHKANITVDEEGTEAAAATAIVVGITSVMPVDQTVDLTLDHSFLFAIVDTDTGTILFLGRVTNP